MFLNSLSEKTNKTYTENGALTYSSTGSDCLDLFSTIGALRREEDGEIILRFIRAYSENADMAMKILFFARDIRGGLGERKVFRIILKWLANNEPQSVKKNVAFVAEYGRYDDLLTLIDTPCEKEVFAYLKNQFDIDMKALNENESVSLLGKWLPSINTSCKNAVFMAKKISKEFGLSYAEYRRALSALRAKIKIIENYLREKDYTFDYEKQPSRAMYKYKNAFIRNDAERYNNYISKVTRGDVVLHTSNVMPYELVEPYLYRNGLWCDKCFMKNITEVQKKVLNATWNSLPDYGGEGNIIAVVDTSASMYYGGHPMPASVALSLGLYFADRNKGIFKNHFIEFSERPQLIEIKGETFADKLRYIATFNEVANTNIEAVFDTILEVAVKNNASQEELPEKLIIISDMEFDECIDNSSAINFDNAKMKYDQYNYKLPQIVFWNVASRNRHQPVKQNEQGVALISGATPRIFEMVVGEDLSPKKFMIDILEGERYEKITA